MFTNLLSNCFTGISEKFQLFYVFYFLCLCLMILNIIVTILPGLPGTSRNAKGDGPMERRGNRPQIKNDRGNRNRRRRKGGKKPGRLAIYGSALISFVKM